MRRGRDLLFLLHGRAPAAEEALGGAEDNRRADTAARAVVLALEDRVPARRTAGSHLLGLEADPPLLVDFMSPRSSQV
jgi:hypothetical protein